MVALIHPAPERRAANLNQVLFVRDAGLEAVGLGWPVAPGTWRSSAGWAGAQGAYRLAPVLDDWYHRPLWTYEEVEWWWQDRPYSPLLVCGHTVDALVVPAELANHAEAGARAVRLLCPAIAMADSHQILLIANGGGPDRWFRSAGCRWLGLGSWIPLPPTRTERWAVRWHRRPDPNTELPGMSVVQRLLARAANAQGRPRR